LECGYPRHPVLDFLVHWACFPEQFEVWVGYGGYCSWSCRAGYCGLLRIPRTLSSTVFTSPSSLIHLSYSGSSNDGIHLMRSLVSSP
jgi:hypothetical protein